MNDQKQEENGNQLQRANICWWALGMKIVIPVLPSMGSYTGGVAWLCVKDNCFDLLALRNCKFQPEKKSDIGDFEPSGAKQLHYTKNW